MTWPGLREAWPVRHLKGVVYPADVEFRRVVVTGPPGSGKSTLVRSLGGWPEEGLIDLAKPRWWRSRELATRPREVHLALPFDGFSSSVPVHDPEWVEARGEPGLAIDRIVLPPIRRWWQLDLRERFTFDFQIPSPDEVLAARRERALSGSHLVDVDLDPAVVERQVGVYRTVAELLHRDGFDVIVRAELGGIPMVIDGPGGARPATRQPFIERVWRRLAGYHEARTVESLEAMRLAGAKIRVPRRLLPLTLRLGRQTVRVDAEPVLVGTGRQRIVVYDPEQRDELLGVVRLEIGGRTRLGRGAEDRFVATKLPSDTLAWFEIVNQPEGVLLVDLDSPTGADVEPADANDGRRLVKARRSALERLDRVLGGRSDEPVDWESPHDLLERVVGRLECAPYREADSRGLPGGLVTLPDSVVPLVVGDLHTGVDNLIAVLTRNRYLQEIEAGRACLVMLGDAVHRDREPDLDEMRSSIATMDLVLALLDRFPNGAVYILGNHDSFSSEVRKGAVPQGVLWREALVEVRGEAYAREMQRFYDRSPYVVEARGLIACHAGPPTETCTRPWLVDTCRHPRLRHQLTWNRSRSPTNPAGYTKRDVRSFRSALGSPNAALVVSHTAPSDQRSWVRDFAGIKGHHLIYSADPERFGVATRWCGEIVLLEYPGEPLADAIAFPTSAPAERLPRPPGPS